MSGGPNAVSLSREAHALQCSLPRETHELLKCHKEIIATEEMHLRVQSGKNMPSVANVNDVLHGAAHAKALYPKAGLVLRSLRWLLFLKGFLPIDLQELSS